MKKKKLRVIVLSVIALSALIYLIYKSSGTVLNSETIALVNGKSIKLRDFEDRLVNIKMSNPPDKIANLPSLKNNVLKRMVIEILILQDADKNGVDVSNEELERYINNIKRGYTPEEFNQLLLNQFKTYEDWVAEVKNSLLIEKTLSKEIIEKINVSEPEIRDRYKRDYMGKTTEAKIKLAQIFTRTKENAEKAVGELNSGKAFADVAKKYSESPEAERGGIVGLITKGEGIEVFDKAFDIRPAGISGIIQSDYGFHIFNVLEYIQPAEVTYEDAKPFITSEIAREKEAKYYEEWLAQRLKDIKVLKNSALIDSVK